jgi:hypothetical protein
MMALRFGLSPNLYWDHGKDFQKVGYQLMDDQIAGILKQRTEVTSATPYNARAKPIEPFFQTIARRFDPLWPSYSGHRPDLCSAKCRDAQKAHKLFVDGKARSTPLPTYMEVCMALAQFIDEYNRQPSRRLGGRSPNEVYEEQCPPESRRIVDPRTLDQLFWQRDKRTILQGGCVELNTIRYEPRDASFGALSAKWKEQVIVARDPYDLSTAIAFDASNREFLGELQIQQLVGQSPHGLLSVDGIKATARRRAKLLRSAKDYVAVVESVSRANRWTSEADSLLDRAGVLGTGTDGRSIAPNAPGTCAPTAVQKQRRLPPSSFVSDAVKTLLEMSEDE